MIVGFFLGGGRHLEDERKWTNLIGFGWDIVSLLLVAAIFDAPRSIPGNNAPEAYLPLKHTSEAYPCQIFPGNLKTTNPNRSEWILGKHCIVNNYTGKHFGQ